MRIRVKENTPWAFGSTAALNDDGERGIRYTGPLLQEYR